MRKLVGEPAASSVHGTSNRESGNYKATRKTTAKTVENDDDRNLR
ncbi:hypothetical protein HALLA_06270 [Halostagnicola larsenii XH-48]|uniref:Uncharacterized protein n=1 Tax=Halostagnicola larsenii XH-48 TaxID=797299 RepID=W0JU30_9EURY|nr:hypothetical protein HALLA_06270 [Halostagnicola larsenii XH-48]